MHIAGPAESGFCSNGLVRAVLAAACLATAAWLAGAEGTEWLRGEAFRAKLAHPENVFWQDVPLRQAVEKFCRAHQVAVLIDRRVDPGQRINGELQAVPVEGVLQQVAESRNLGLTLFGPLVYLGPREFTARLRTLAEMRREDVRRLLRADDAVGKLAQSRAFAWDDLATPRELLGKLAAEAGIEIVGLERVPHDLWAAADLPPLPLVDRITLVAGQFDLTFTISADQPVEIRNPKSEIRNNPEIPKSKNPQLPTPNSRLRLTLVPLPDEVAIVRSYPAGATPEELVDKWQTLAPGCQIKLAGDKIYVKGRLEDIERIEAESEGGRRRAEGGKTNPEDVKSPNPQTSRFTGRVVNKPLEEVLQYVGTQLGVELKIDRQALAAWGISLDQLVSFSVKDASGDELLEAVLRPVGCKFTRQGKLVQIHPAD